MNLFIFRKGKFLKSAAIFFVVNFLTQIFAPTFSYALTGGPSQPEVQSFEPVGTTEMVDVFSGDFVYNIPLIDVGGYPINLSYHSGITMDQEASWVGLGWNISPGVINRNMRGLPDDFNGDEVRKEYNIKDNVTYGISVAGIPELLGVDLGDVVGLQASLGFTFNNYKGVGFNTYVGATFSAGEPNKGADGNLGFSASSDDGVGITASASFRDQVESIDKKEVKSTSLSGGLSYNSRAGLKSLTIGGSFSHASKTRGFVRGTGSRSLSLTFANPSYVPQISMPMVNSSVSFNATIGLAFFTGHPNVNLNGFVSKQKLKDREKNVGGYGYMYSENATNNSLHDINREKDGGFSSYTPNLPVTNYTYDVYAVTGQGVGGMYRPYRSDLGTVHDDVASNIGGSLSLPGIEVGGGNAFKLGGNISGNMTFSITSKWMLDNFASRQLQFQNKAANSPFENVYFKQAGEKTAETDPNFIAMMGGTEPVAAALGSIPSNIYVWGKNQLVDRNGNVIQDLNGNQKLNQPKRTARQRRTQTISQLTLAQAANYGFAKNVEYYDPAAQSFASVPKSAYSGKTHHIGEIVTTRTDGARYVYGIPAYNHFQEEATFAITEGNPDCATGLVTYDPSTDDTRNNNKGLDNYFNKTTLPAYAHSYLLTSVLSPDYVDVTMNGPTTDDYGNFTKINYSRYNSDFRWRTPFEENKASYNEGMKSVKSYRNDKGEDFGDDKGSYIYGSKELWYVHSIETKTHVAIFHLSPRRDGYGVKGQDGGLGENSIVYKLDKIELFARPEYEKAQADPGYEAEVIKAVHFEYNYELCQGIPNNNGQPETLNGANVNFGGKLTLKKVYFTYGNSKKGKFSPYSFTYNTFNPSYNLKGSDRWGTYKLNPSGASCTNIFAPAATSEFPYVIQDKAITDQYSSAWELTTVNLPSGGKITVNYESDDYAYVQDRHAMEMMEVVAMKSSVPGIADIGNNGSNYLTLYEDNNNLNQYLLFRLNKPLPAGRVTSEGGPEHYFKSRYLNGIHHLYYKFLVNLNGSSLEVLNNNGQFEYVPGYAEIDRSDAGYGSLVSSDGQNYDYAWVKVKTEPVGDGNNSDPVNPIARQAWMFARLNLPRVAYQQPDPSGSTMGQMLEAMVSAAVGVKQFIQGINRYLRNNNFAKRAVRGKSWVRINSGDGFKLGGGSRVKEIKISDEWSQINTTAGNSEYGQRYEYTTFDPARNAVISSGVTAYEPMIGQDENPFRQPVFYEDKKVLAPNDKYTQETPFGESFFPSPVVGYSKVTIRNIEEGAGKVVHEFYTARDFPTITKQTNLDSKRFKPIPLFNFFKKVAFDWMTASQGYAIELNDMHGKPKAQWVYQQADDNGKEKRISGVEYFYKERKLGGTQFGANPDAVALDNNVTTIERDGTIRTTEVGMDYDFVYDTRESNTITANGEIEVQADGFVIIPPIVLPALYGDINFEHTRFRSGVITKVINRYGILDRVVAHDLGSSVESQNLLWDAETGEVLLTRTINEFEDYVFNFTYPAHWVYDEGMGPAYKNTGFVFSGGNLNNYGYMFVPGDELGVRTASGNNYVWVASATANSVTLIDENGEEVPASDVSYAIVIRSGRRNMASVAVGGFSSLKNPVQGNQLVIDAGLEILDASAIEYLDFWGVPCACGFDPDTQTHNPYLMAIEGNWRPVRSYLYLTDRKQSRKNHNTDIRLDGSFRDFKPFWLLASGSWSKRSDILPWQFTSEITKYNQNGFEIENRDALGRYSAALYGYSKNLPTGVANNARLREIGFDSFEDYDFSGCDEHFNFRNTAEVDTREFHTGRRSLKVTSEATLTKPLNDCCK